MRFRVDGTLREVVQPNRALHAALISRLKIMADLDIAENACRRTAASACAWARAPSTCASPPAQRPRRTRAVLRLLDKSESKLSLESVGMQGDALARFEQLMVPAARHHLVTGPHGFRAKPPRLYAALQRLDATAATS